MDNQLLGIALQSGSSSCAEIKEISPGSPAALAGMTTKIRSFNDSSVLVPWCITEINGRPLNMFAKEGEAMERLQALGNISKRFDIISCFLFFHGTRSFYLI